jgi:hypothetical protein
MKTKRITYWITTTFVALIMAVSGLLAVIRAPQMMAALAHLGYPRYFASLLGTGKLIGAAVLLLPGMPRLKEWAYVACGITVLSGAYSHLLSGDGLRALDPLVAFAALIISYQLRPASRRLLPGVSN